MSTLEELGCTPEILRHAEKHIKKGFSLARVVEEHRQRYSIQNERFEMTARIAGRMMLKRVMGKASFATLQDSTGRIWAGTGSGLAVYLHPDMKIGSKQSFSIFFPAQLFSSEKHRVSGRKIKS